MPRSPEARARIWVEYTELCKQFGEPHQRQWENHRRQLKARADRQIGPMRLTKEELYATWEGFSLDEIRQMAGAFE